ncbi:MAG TPA: hypothetical protein VGK47_04060 [Nitrososphaeraceae archaeon]
MANPIAYLAAFIDSFEPSIATRILEYLVLVTFFTIVYTTPYSISKYAWIILSRNILSNTVKEAESNQKAFASGNANTQNCEQIDIDSHTPAGDEGVDCHKSQPQSTEQTASD